MGYKSYWTPEKGDVARLSDDIVLNATTPILRARLQALQPYLRGRHVRVLDVRTMHAQGGDYVDAEVQVGTLIFWTSGEDLQDPGEDAEQALRDTAAGLDAALRAADDLKSRQEQAAAQAQEAAERAQLLALLRMYGVPAEYTPLETSDD